MADLDAELLALAGGDSSDEEETRPVSNGAQENSSATLQATNNTTSTNESSNSSNMASKPSITVNGGTSRDTKKSRKHDSEEEGEASSTPASPDSLQSAPMSESDSDSGPAGNSAGDDVPLYPVDNQFTSQQDKKEIMALSEVQRESILADRAAQRDRQIQDQYLRRLIQNRDKAEAKPDKKRKAGLAELEDSPARKSSRQKTTLGGRKVGETSGAIEAYKRQREEKGLRDEQRRLEGEERRRKLRDSPPEKYSDADADGESEVEWDDRAKSAQPPNRDEEPAQLIDFEHVRVGRDNFAKICFYPGFDQAIANCYARVNIGPDRDTGENVYRMAKIKGFTEGKPYAMEGVNGKMFTTNQYAIIAFGKAEKPWPFIACSNAKFKMAEFQRYTKAMADEDVPVPTKPNLIQKNADINKLLNHSWTEAEINEKLKRQGVLQNRFAHIERDDIARRRNIAVDRGDESAIAKLDAELAALDGPKLAFGTKLNKAAAEAPAQEMSQQERLAELNRINRKKNIEEVRKAQRAERKAQLAAAKAVERGEAVQDPFARVQTRAKTHHDVHKDMLASLKPPNNLDDLFDGGSNTSRAGTPLSNGANTPKRAVTPKPSGPSKPLKAGGLPTIATRNMDDDIIGAMDLGIEIDI